MAEPPGIKHWHEFRLELDGALPKYSEIDKDTLRDCLQFLAARIQALEAPPAAEAMDG